MLIGVASFSLFLFVARYLTEWLDLPIPYGLLGLILCLLFLMLLGRMPLAFDKASQPLLKHMSLFFVPAVVSVVTFGALFLEHWAGMLLAVFVATLASFIITLFLARYTLGRHK